MAPKESIRLAELEAEHRDLVFSAFSNLDALRLGTLITEAALAVGQNVVIDIRRPGIILFRAALDGTAPDQHEWVAAKSAVVFRMEASTALVSERFVSQGIDPFDSWLRLPHYAVAARSVPIRVAGVGVVAAATASGLESDDDHILIVDGIRAYLDGAMPNRVGA